MRNISEVGSFVQRPKRKFDLLIKLTNVRPRARLRPIMNLSIVIPAYNESRKIVDTLFEIVSFLDGRPWKFELIVVDDGSSDATGTLVDSVAEKDDRIKCLRNGHNAGKGYSIRRGIEKSQGAIVGFVDADNKTEIRCLELVMELLAQPEIDGVLGDRTLVNSDIARARRPFRQWGSDLFRYLLRIYAGLGNFPDTQCGFKFFSKAVAKDLFSKQQVDGYMFDVEVLMLAVNAGYQLERIPVIWRDDPDSRFNPITGMAKNFSELYRIRRTYTKGNR